MKFTWRDAFYALSADGLYAIDNASGRYTAWHRIGGQPSSKSGVMPLALGCYDSPQAAARACSLHFERSQRAAA